MVKNLAPIGLTVYSRISHLEKCVNALKENPLASESELFIFSDAPREGDEQKVSEVRKYLQKIKGFRNVKIIHRNKNNRVYNNREGLKFLLSQYGRAVWLAEDVIPAPGFLIFINQCLEKYKLSNKIFSIAGYMPPIKIPERYKHDTFLLRRFSAWGFGIWKRSFDMLRYISIAEFEAFKSDREKVLDFTSAGGRDMLEMLKSDVYGHIDAGDVKLMYAQYLNDQYTIYPSESLTQNVGHDGTGTYCGVTNRFDVLPSKKTIFTLQENPIPDPDIVLRNYNFRNI
jgi:hypothetical protein